MDIQRIEDLRRRVDRDPTSIAFAQLAEEYRRAGRPQDAVDTCRAGLTHHSLYLSARVTLGRALMDLDRFDEAQKEFEVVLQHAADNLAAIRALAEIHQRRGEAGASAFSSQPVTSPPAAPEPPVRVTPDSPLPAEGTVDPALETLEQWLDAIVEDRASPR